MKRKISHIGLALAMGLLISSCTKEGDSDTRLPDGKYPMTFTAAVEGQTASRATTDNTWTVDDAVAIEVGNTVKKYTVTNASNGTLSVVSGTDPHYWTSTTMNVTAWHSASYAGSRPTTFSVLADQSGSGYEQSDFLYTAQQLTFNATQLPALAFKHLPSKVIVNLKNGEGVTADEVANATVSIVNQATVSGTIADDGTVAQVTSGSAKITPYALSVAPGFQKSVQALLIPQQMQSKRFIKITLGGTTFYYTPTKETDANLTAGKQYTYAITVKKDKIEVTVTGNGTSWTDEPTGSTTNDEVTFHITAPTEGVTIAAGSGGSLTNNGNGSYTLTGGNELIVTVDANGQTDKFLKVLPAKGLYDITSGSYTSTSYTYTYALKGDIILSSPVFVDKTTPAVGDYFYFDGTWSAELWDKRCVGIVFKAGMENNDAVNDYAGSGLTGSINGYAVSVQDAARFGILWSTVQENCGTSTATDDYKGYANTAKILSMSGYSEATYPICWTTTHFGTTLPAPTNSSGWYLPSAGQMIDIVNSWKNNGIIRQKLDALPNNHEWKIPTTSHGYATSTEYQGNASNNVCRITQYGNVESESKNYREGNFAVRPILTF